MVTLNPNLGVLQLNKCLNCAIQSYGKEISDCRTLGQLNTQSDCQTETLRKSMCLNSEPSTVGS